MTDTVDPIGILGTGRVAQTLGRLLSENGRPVAAVAGRNPGRTALAALFIGGRATPVTIEELPALSSHVLIAVSDRGVEPVAEILAKSGFRCGVALHTCGAKGPLREPPLRHRTTQNTLGRTRYLRDRSLPTRFGSCAGL